MKEALSRERLKELYLPPVDEFVFVEVPEMQYFVVDGEGSPDDEAFTRALQWLFAAVHPIKRMAKDRMGSAYVEAPLEALWWADDPKDLVAARKDKLKWRLMIVAPEWADDALFADAVAETEKRRGGAPATLRLADHPEGRSVQIMHIGPYDKEASALARRLHHEFLPAHGLVPNGPHHEIYLNDPKRTAPARWRTVVRQPVRPQ
ncbi:MAG: GyrI-like domain-containing protein [Gemmatimonadota bacterium]